MVTPQKPAEGILTLDDSTHYTAFQVECNCTCEDHAFTVTICVERDTDVGFDDFVDVTTYGKLYTNWKKSSSLWLRLKSAWQILWSGVIELEHSTMLSDQAALNLAEALKTSVEKHQEQLNK